MVAAFGNYTWTFFLPLYYADKFGSSPPVIGLVYTAWLLLIGLGAAPAGALADRYGRKIIVVLAGLISALGVLILAYSSGFILAAIAFPITGLGTSFLSISNVMIAESVEAKRRGTAFGTFQMMTYILPSLSPLIGGVELLNDSSNFFPLFLLGASLAIAATIIRALFTKETLARQSQDSISGKVEGNKNRSSYFRSVSKVFTNRILLTLMLVYSVYNLIIDQGSYILPLYGRNQLSLNPETLGLLFAVITFMSALARFPFGKMSDTIGRRRTIMISWIGESSTIFIFVFAPRGDLALALLGIGAWAVFGVMDGPAINAWLADATSASARGLSMGSFYSAAFLVAVPFFSVAGFLYELGPKLPFYANSILGAASLVLLMTLTSHRGEKKS
jgi:MFS family permease